MNNGRDCPHGRQVGKCDTCDLIVAELELQKVTAERDALAVQVLKLEKRIKAINEGVEEYKSMCSDATADLVHKALMSVREEIIQRDLYQTAPDFIEQFANQYAEQIRKGGAE